MALQPVSRLFQQYVEDELLRAPMLYEQLGEAVADAIRRALPGMNAVQRSAVADLLQALQAQRPRMLEYFMHSLREQVNAELSRQAPAAAAKVADKPRKLSLVDEEEVAVDVELSHAIETIKSEAEYELRELQTFTAALVGDLDMSRDHNPLRAEIMARAVWNSAQAMPVSRSHHVAFMRHASKPLAQLLRTSYAASTSRLEGMGVEPAAYRTMILPSGSRRGARAGVETTFTPDLYRMSETMPAPLDGPSGGTRADKPGIGYQGQARVEPAARPALAAPREHWSEVARGTTQRADRQAIELVSRLFEAMMADTRVPPDVSVLISRLHGPAMRLALRDRTLLDHSRHPLWRFINVLVFAAQMSPDADDPERYQLLKLAQATIDQLASEQVQNSPLYRWALDRLDAFLAKRTQRRLASVATQIGSLQKLEASLSHEQGPPSTMSGPLDHHQLDTVPAEFMDTQAPEDASSAAASEWLARIKAGDWVRMFFGGRWVQAQLLWPGDKREFFLFGDGASDTTWAVRRNALVMMFGNGLAKTMRLRSIVGSAAAKVQEQVGAQSAA